MSRMSLRKQLSFFLALFYACAVSNEAGDNKKRSTYNSSHAPIHNTYYDEQLAERLSI